MADFTIRLATLSDCPAISDIYNHYVLNSTCTYQIEPESLADRQAWFAGHGPSHPVTVAEVNGNVIGWGSLSPFHHRAAFAKTVENSVYLCPDWLGQGVGKSLLADLIHRASALRHHAIIAAVCGEQAVSIALHVKLGFAEVGRLTEAGFKMQRWLDMVYLQKML